MIPAPVLAVPFGNNPNFEVKAVGFSLALKLEALPLADVVTSTQTP